MRHDQRRLLHALDNLGDSEGLAGAGRAQQRLARVALFEALDQLVDRLGLIAGRLEIGDEFKLLGHRRLSIPNSDLVYGAAPAAARRACHIQRPSVDVTIRREHRPIRKPH